jgi:hypothetical protein
MKLESIALEKVQFYARQTLSPALMQTAKLSSWIEPVTRDLCLQLEAAVYGRRVHEESRSVPLDWWEAVKQRFAPRWFLRRYPVRYRTFTLLAYHLYPGLVFHGHRPVLHTMIRED